MSDDPQQALSPCSNCGTKCGDYSRCPGCGALGLAERSDCTCDFAAGAANCGKHGPYLEHKTTLLPSCERQCGHASECRVMPTECSNLSQMEPCGGGCEQCTQAPISVSEYKALREALLEAACCMEDLVTSGKGHGYDGLTYGAWRDLLGVTNDW